MSMRLNVILTHLRSTLKAGLQVLSLTWTVHRIFATGFILGKHRSLLDSAGHCQSECTLYDVRIALGHNNGKGGFQPYHA
jgi:hypothetical protein